MNDAETINIDKEAEKKRRLMKSVLVVREKMTTARMAVTSVKVRIVAMPTGKVERTVMAKLTTSVVVVMDALSNGNRRLIAREVASPPLSLHVGSMMLPTARSRACSSGCVGAWSNESPT